MPNPEDVARWIVQHPLLTIVCAFLIVAGFFVFGEVRHQLENAIPDLNALLLEQQQKSQNQ